MNGFLNKMLKSAAYASGGGVIAIGGATIDLVDADLLTILYMVLSAIIFNFIKEMTKKYKNGNNN